MKGIRHTNKSLRPSENLRCNILNSWTFSKTSRVELRSLISKAKNVICLKSKLTINIRDKILNTKCLFSHTRGGLDSLSVPC